MKPWVSDDLPLLNSLVNGNCLGWRSTYYYHFWPRCNVRNDGSSKARGGMKVLGVYHGCIATATSVNKGNKC
jgi:hypothetical protein